MSNPSFKEDLISQFPALQMLIKLGYTYLPPAKAMEERGGKSSQVLLENILRKQLHIINKIRLSSTRTDIFNSANIENGIQALKNLPFNDGYIAACQAAYNMLLLGSPLEQAVDGDKKTYNLHYIDWKTPENNVFHVTEQYAVMRTGRTDTYIPDIVLFINGIPICIIESKRPDMKGPVDQGISQHLRNQQPDGIRSLYVYSQLLAVIATFQAKYATTDTKPEFWFHWTEQQAAIEKLKIRCIKDLVLDQSVMEQLLDHRDKNTRIKLESMAGQEFEVTPQDEYLYFLCRPDRLIELAKDYILFEAGKYKKIARYQQFFAVKKIILRLQNMDGGRRQGGVIWHTQGSGKSLTMVMLAKKLYETIRNPKIILVTDRIDLDQQLHDTFRDAQVPINRATTGINLVELLQSKSDRVITTIVNKFEAAVNQLGNIPLESSDIIVLIDEGHRSQYNKLNVKMQKVLPNACFLAFTGTPLMKKEKRNTVNKFGGIIDSYTILQAVADGAIVPIIYEGRHAVLDVDQKSIDRKFARITESLEEAQQAELKRKFSRPEILNRTVLRIEEIAADISNHFLSNWGKDLSGESSGFKGMVVVPDKLTAIRYKKAFDQIGKVSTEVIMSPPDTREGTEDVHDKPSDEVLAFWKSMEAKHGANFEVSLIKQFKSAAYPQIIIVIDKLITGFDAPSVIVMYMCRKLREHTLLQAIARVNRVAQGKENGFIIDYEGVLGHLDKALNIYSSLSDFEAADLEGSFKTLESEINKLPQVHADLSDLFKTIVNKFDVTNFVSLLADDAIRVQFYQRFSAFAKLMKMAEASIDYDRITSEKIKRFYEEQLKFFVNLRNTVFNIYSDTVDFSKFEKQLRILLDQHVGTDGVIQLTEQVSILNAEAFKRELEKIPGNRAKAEMIASRTSKYITEKMDEDPVFFKSLSELISQTISDLRAQRLEDADALQKLLDLCDKAVTRKGDDIPQALQNLNEPIAFYRLLKNSGTFSEVEGIEFSKQADAIIRFHQIVDWKNKPDIIRKMSFLISEYLVDDLKFDFDSADSLADQCMEVAKHKYN